MQFTRKTARLMASSMLIWLCFSPAVYAQSNNAEILARLELLQQQIDELKLQLVQTQSRSIETDARVEAVAEVIESEPRHAPVTRKTSIGGYGELHYNNLSATEPSRDVEAIDFHRFVLFFGHEFDDKTRFYSEVELEHAYLADTGGNTSGEVELEQAFIEFDLKRGLHARAGISLVPIGILNETHEPPSFYGVERNDVENIIVPATWWEAGVGLNGRFGPNWDWAMVASSGLQIPTTGSNAFRVRSGRQKVAKASASDGALTARLRYLGIPGLQAAISLQYQFDPSQVANDGLDDGTLLEAHIDYRHAGFGLRALFAQWNFSGDAVELRGADRQTGWYIEPSYRLNDRLGFYTRFEDLNAARNQDQFQQWELGLNWWPNENVVIKFDYRDRDHDLLNENGRDFKGIDVGLGYSF